jgi:hypothetical protein
MVQAIGSARVPIATPVEGSPSAFGFPGSGVLSESAKGCAELQR